MPETDQGDLKEFAWSGSAAAFERLVRRHSGLVYGVCLRRLASPEDAEDASQAVFIALARKAGNISPGKLTSWLHGAAMKAALLLARSAATRKRHEKEAAKMRDAGPESAGKSAEHWESVRPHLDAEVAGLPARLREPLVRHFLAGRSFTEVAAELGLPRRTAASRVEAGLERLRRGLARSGVALEGGALGTLLVNNAHVAVPASLGASLSALASGGPAALTAAAGGAGASALAEGVLKMMFWMKVKVIAAVVAALTVAGVGGGVAVRTLAAAESGKREKKVEEKVVRGGPLAGLPSKPGPHIAKIEALADNQWLKLGTPAPDPKWGEGRGRAWCCKMPYAPEFGGAFLNGQGPHKYTRPDGHYDDIFFYDLYAHRWICLYPGVNTRTFAADVKAGRFKVNDDCQVVDQNGTPIFAVGGHSYQRHAYDTDRHMFVTFSRWGGLPGDQHCRNAPWCRDAVAVFKEQMKGKTDKVQNTPYYYDTTTGELERPGFAGNQPLSRGGVGIICYVPTKKLLWIYLGNRGKQPAMYYDTRARKIIGIKAKGLKTLIGMDVCGCYDSKRDRIYLGGDSKGAPSIAGQVFTFDVAAETWSVTDPPRKDDPAVGFPSNHGGVIAYDAAADRVVSIKHHIGDGTDIVSTYDPETGRWESPGKPPAAFVSDRGSIHGFYSPEVNAHFVYLAGDGHDRGTMWVYRYKRAANKK